MESTPPHVENTNDTRPPVYRENGKWIFRASGIMSCEAALIGVKLGFDVSPPGRILRNAYQRGVNAEPIIREYMNEVLGPVSPVPELNWEILDNIVIRGHPDGDSPYGIHEYKNLGLDFYISWMGNGLKGMGALGKKYAVQGLIYCMAAERPSVIFACRNEEDGKISYRDYSAFELLEVAEITLDALEEKVQRIVEATTWPGCDGKDWPCPIWLYHNEGFDEIMALRPQETAVDIQFEPGQLEAIVDLRIGQRRLQYLVDQVKTKLGKEPYRRKVDGYLVNYYSRSGREKLNMQKMVADGIDLSKYMEPGGEEWVLQVKELDE